MTRLTNDIETLFELLAGFGVLLGEFVPFFVAITIMVALDPTLTLDLLAILPLAAVATWVFRVFSRTIYRAIRSFRSEERRVGKESVSTSRSRWCADH